MMNRELFEKSLICPLRFWGNKSKTEVIELIGEEAAKMVNFDQKNPHHCYDLFFHTLHTVQFFADGAPAELRIAAFFHDISKPYTAQEKQGRLVFYGHAQKSAEIARQMLYRLGYNEMQTERICFYIGHHDDFISWVLPTEQYDKNNPYLIEISKANVASHIDKIAMEHKSCINIRTYGLWDNLLLLCRADASAQAGYIYMDGVVIDSREHKLNKINAVNAAVNKVFSKSL